MARKLAIQIDRDYSITINGWSNSTASPSFTKIALTTPALSASIRFIIFIASTIQSASPTLTVCPTSTKAFASGLGYGRMSLPLVNALGGQKFQPLALQQAPLPQEQLQEPQLVRQALLHIESQLVQLLVLHD